MNVRQKTAALIAAAIRVAALRDDRPVHRAADENRHDLMLAVSYGLLQGRKALKKNLRDADGAAKAVRDALLLALPAPLAAAHAAGANASLSELKQMRRAQGFRALLPPGTKKEQPPFSMKFDATDPKSVEYAKEHAGELATQISDTTRDAIKDAIAEALAGGSLDDASDDILDAVGDEDRADMIARTEAMDAANEGQQAGWEEAVELGYLPEDAQVVWIATSGACDDCADMDGETRDVNGDYDDADYADGPPAHPNCRCTEGIAS